MGHTYQFFRGNMLFAKDSDLLTVMGLVVEKVGLERQEWEKLRPVQERWLYEFEACAPGVIDLDLDRLLTSEEARRQLVKLLASLKSELQVFTEDVPIARIGPVVRQTGGTCVRGYPSHRLVDMLSLLINLLEHQSIGGDTSQA